MILCIRKVINYLPTNTFDVATSPLEYEGGSIISYIFIFPAFKPKNNTAPVNNHPSVDNCQRKIKLRQLVCV